LSGREGGLIHVLYKHYIFIYFYVFANLKLLGFLNLYYELDPASSVMLCCFDAIRDSESPTIVNSPPKISISDGVSPFEKLSERVPPRIISCSEFKSFKKEDIMNHLLLKVYDE